MLPKGATEAGTAIPHPSLPRRMGHPTITQWFACCSPSQQSPNINYDTP